MESVETSRIIVIGDLHGDIARLCSCLYMAKIIDTNMEWIAQPSNTIVVQIGDQLDSLNRDNTEDWEKLPDIKLLQFTDQLDTIAQKKGGRFISLLGNHELMNVMGNFSYVSQNSMEKSGGEYNRFMKFINGGTYAKILAKRPVVLKIGKILFCHAGVLPHHLDLVNNNLTTLNTILQKQLNGNGHQLSPQDLEKAADLYLHELSLLWNRHYVNHINEESYAMLNDVLKRTHTHAMIIGHNTVPSITTLYNNKLWIVDVGLSRAYTNTNLEILEIINDTTFNIIQAVKN